MKTSRLAVVIATAGRPDAVVDCLAGLRAQTRRADRTIISVSCESDLPVPEALEGVETVMGSKGATLQRNRGLEMVLSDCDFVAFFDDDYIPSIHALAGIQAMFEGNQDVVGMTGHLIADGINSPGISAEDAIARVQEYDKSPPPEPRIIEDLEGLYGCNMTYRSSAIGDKRFDENLPLYAWQEDIDFANQVAKHGRLVRTNAFAGLHRGAKSGRTSGVRFGYSQIANPMYLMSKGTMSSKFGWRLMLKNLAANHVKVFRPEPWVDRKGRVKGNWIAIRDVITRKIAPGRIMEI